MKVAESEANLQHAKATELVAEKTRANKPTACAHETAAFSTPTAYLICDAGAICLRWNAGSFYKLEKIAECGLKSAHRRNSSHQCKRRLRTYSKTRKKYAGDS